MASEKIDIMNELIRIGLEFVRKKAGIVIVLLVVCGGLVWLALEQKRELVNELMTNRAEYRQELRAVSARLDACEESRARLVVEVLKVQVEVLRLRKR